MNRRRTLLTALSASALPVPFAALAQQPNAPAAPAGAPGKIWRVGILALPSRPASPGPNFSGGIPQGLRDFGYVEGKNLAAEWRYAGNDPERLPDLAQELVQWKPDVLVSAGDQAAMALKKATPTIPIVIAGTSDPVRLGLIQSLARPGGNITGVTNIASDLAPKQLELLLAMVTGTVPKVSRVAVLTYPRSESHAMRLQSTQTAAKTLGVTIVPVEAQDAAQIDAAFVKMRLQNASAVIVILHPFFQQRSQQIGDLAAQYRLPSMTSASLHTEAGGLMSYGANLFEHYRRAGYYADRIFKGTRPADLPVEQPTRFELIINGKTAKALGLKIPHSLLIMADKVIE